MKSRNKEKINPYGKKEVKIQKQSTAKTAMGVKPVAKDTNKTRRRQKKPTVGQIK